MALPASDTFTDSNGTSLTAHSASWTQRVGAMAIQSNALRGNTGAYSIAAWTADSFNANHYAQGTVSGSGAGYVGLAVRVQANGDCYNFQWSPSDGTAYLTYMSSGGTVENPVDTAPAPASGSVIRLEVSGTTIRVFDDGVEIMSGDSAANGNLTGGAAGVFSYDSVTTVLLDNFTADDVGSGSNITITPSLGSVPVTGRAPGLGFGINMPDVP